jgi:hypothetical protein
MPRKIIADQNSAKRVTDEMDARRSGSFTIADRRREDGFAQAGDAAASPYRGEVDGGRLRMTSATVTAEGF